MNSSKLHQLHEELLQFVAKKANDYAAPMPATLRAKIRDFVAQMGLITRREVLGPQNMFNPVPSSVDDLIRFHKYVSELVNALPTFKPKVESDIPRGWIKLASVERELRVPKSTAYELALGLLEPRDKKLHVDGRMMVREVAMMNAYSSKPLIKKKSRNPSGVS